MRHLIQDGSFFHIDWLAKKLQSNKSFVIVKRFLHARWKLKKFGGISINEVYLRKKGLLLLQPKI